MTVPIRVNLYHGPSTRNDGCSFFLEYALRRIPGVIVNKYEAHGDPRLHPKCDLNICVDWAEDIWKTSREFIEPRPLVYWMSDTHCSPEARKFRYTKARRADHVYCAIWSDVPRLEKEGVKAKWLPYAAEPLCFTTWDADPKADIGFVGHIGDYEGREDFLEEMFKAFPNFHFEYNRYLELCAWEMRRSKVTLNHVWRRDSTNMRVFEGMAVGRCLLTPKTEDLPWLHIEDGKHCLTYAKVEEAIEKVRAILKDDEKRLAMGKAGRELIVAEHTFVHRALTILRDVTGDPWEVNEKEIIDTIPGKGREWGDREARLPLALPV